MLRSRFASLVLCIAIVVVGQASAAVPTLDPPPAPAQLPGPAPRTIRVAVFPDPPFAMQDSTGRWTGFSMLLLDAAAVEAHLVLDIRPCGSLDDLFRQVGAGESDIGVGNTLVTSLRLQKVDFTQPTLEGGLRVMVPSDRSHTLAKLWDGLVNGGHVKVVAVGAAVAVALSIVLVSVLRRLDREFTRHWHEGFAEAFYHVVSVAVTGKTSYKGNIAPSWIGRIFAALWLVFGVASVAYLTSSLTSVMTANTIRSHIAGPQDLRGKTVGTLEGSVGDRYCGVHGLDVVRFATVEEAATALAAKQVEAVVADAQSLEYYDTSHPDVPITTIGETFERRHYAFPVRMGDDDLRRRMDEAIVSLRESGSLDRIRSRWFGH